MLRVAAAISESMATGLSSDASGSSINAVSNLILNHVCSVSLPGWGWVRQVDLLGVYLAGVVGGVIYLTGVLDGLPMVIHPI